MTRRFGLALLIACAAALGFLAGQLFDATATADDDRASLTYRQLGVFAEVLGHVETNYVDDIGPERLIEGAINGMMAQLDAHSTWMNPQQFASMQQDTRGEYVGVGMEIGVREERVIVLTVFENGPAADAGLQPGDRIDRIDDEDARSFNVQEVVSRLRGLRGMPVEVAVRRGDEQLQFTVIRDVIHVEAIRTELPVPGYGYIRLRAFQSDVSSALRTAIDDLEARNGRPLNGLILDLRNNPGGLLREGINVSDVFLDSGRIVSTSGRTGNREQTWNASNRNTRYRGPLVVLVNGSTASASEIVAGALQDRERAAVIGVPTFGKGSVQSVISLSNGSGMKLTVSRYYTPSGRSIHGAGITPNLLVSPSADQATALDELDAEDGDAAGDGAGQPIPHDRIPTYEGVTDVQIRAALWQLGAPTP